MDEFSFPTNDFSLLESCRLYINAKYKSSNCCKIKPVIQRSSVKKASLEFLQNTEENPLFNKVAACEHCEIFNNTFFDRKPPLAASGKTRTKSL